MTVLKLSAFHDGTRTHETKNAYAPSCYHNEDDYSGYLGLDERFAAMPIHQADTYLSKTRTEMCHCSHVVVTRFDTARLMMGLWVTAEPLIVSSTLPWPPKSLFVRHAYSNTGSYQWRISHKAHIIQLYAEMTAWILTEMTIILIFCPNFSGI